MITHKRTSDLPSVTAATVYSFAVKLTKNAELNLLKSASITLHAPLSTFQLCTVSCCSKLIDWSTYMMCNGIEVSANTSHKVVRLLLMLLKFLTL